MATSTFGKQFKLSREKTDDFVAEMTKKVTPTLTRDFNSNAICLEKERELKNKLVRALRTK